MMLCVASAVIDTVLVVLRYYNQKPPRMLVLVFANHQNVSHRRGSVNTRNDSPRITIHFDMPYHPRVLHQPLGDSWKEGVVCSIPFFRWT